jgi:hypothetical protein
MIPNFQRLVKEIGRRISKTRARVGWSKGNISFGGAFRFAKYSLQFRRKKGQSERGRGGRKELGGRNSATPEPKSRRGGINSAVSAVPQLAGHQSKTIFNSF